MFSGRTTTLLSESLGTTTTPEGPVAPVVTIRSAVSELAGATRMTSGAAAGTTTTLGSSSPGTTMN
jgi:hypothetical protein